MTPCAPELHISVTEYEGEVIPRHVLCLARDQDHPGVGLGLEVQRHVEVAVGVLECGQREVGEAGEARSPGRGDHVPAPGPAPPRGTHAPLGPGLRDPALAAAALQAAIRIHVVNVVRQGNIGAGVGEGAGRIHLLILQLRYGHVAILCLGVTWHPRVPDHCVTCEAGAHILLRVCIGDLDVSRLQQLCSVLLCRACSSCSTRPCSVVNVFGGEAEAGELVIRQMLPVLRGLDVHLYLYLDVALSALTLAINVGMGCIES